MNRTRAYRRWQSDRHKKKAKRQLVDWNFSIITDRDIGFYAKTPKSCSCIMCCSPRKYGELTRQEILGLQLQ